MNLESNGNEVNFQMREPRNGIPWSNERLRRRKTYSTWMGSQEWLKHRELWRLSWIEVTGAEPYCLICLKNWELRSGDLHHRSYSNLGNEKFQDLIPLCRNCHCKLHLILESSPAWRRLTRAQASDTIVLKLRQLEMVGRSCH